MTPGFATRPSRPSVRILSGFNEAPVSPGFATLIDSGSPVAMLTSFNEAPVSPGFAT